MVTNDQAQQIDAVSRQIASTIKDSIDQRIQPVVNVCNATPDDVIHWIIHVIEGVF